MPNDAAGQWTDQELEGIARALELSGGAAPEGLCALRTPALEFGRKEYRSLFGALLSLACLLAAFDFCVSVPAVAFAARPRPAARPAAAADPDASEAIALVQEWKLAGDELPVLRRLRGAVRNPGRARAWSAERTDADAYLVVFREPAGTPAYAFEVDLETGLVLTAPETVERLTAMRVREDAAFQLDLVASAR